MDGTGAHNHHQPAVAVRNDVLDLFPALADKIPVFYGKRKDLAQFGRRNDRGDCWNLQVICFNHDWNPFRV